MRALPSDPSHDWRMEDEDAPLTDPRKAEDFGRPVDVLMGPRRDPGRRGVPVRFRSRTHDAAVPEGRRRVPVRSTGFGREGNRGRTPLRHRSRIGGSGRMVHRRRERTTGIPSPPVRLFAPVRAGSMRDWRRFPVLGPDHGLPEAHIRAQSPDAERRRATRNRVRALERPSRTGRLRRARSRPGRCPSSPKSEFPTAWEGHADCPGRMVGSRMRHLRTRGEVRSMDPEDIRRMADGFP